MLSSTNKKVKTSDSSNNNYNNNAVATRNGENDFDKVKQYLLNCPLVSSDHPAIRVAIAAVDKEQQRMERDRKLQQKFAQNNKTAAVGEPTVVVSASSALEDSVVVVDRRLMASSASPTPGVLEPDNHDGFMDEMEWQDIEDKGKDDAWDDDPSSNSFLGRTLAKATIDAISEQNTKLQTPLAAIAVAFHASLRSDWLGFSCTGVPEDQSTTKGGFAPPVRELPKTQFLPPAWDVNPQRLALRYRKAGTGAMILTVELGAGGAAEDQTVTVRWQPTTSKDEPSSQTLSFPLGDHINLDSWNAALKTTSSVSPALHYKSLALLLSNFCRTFDLGTIQEPMEDSTPASIPTTGTSANTNGLPAIQKSDFVPKTTSPLLVVPPAGMSLKPSLKYEVPTTLDQAFPGLNRPVGPHGDFAGDLLPSGLPDPRIPVGGDGRMGGNLMGPNHPMFQGRGGGDDHFGIPIGGPGSMQPRFDPIYPEAIDLPRTERICHRPGRGSNRPSRSGEPNPDHLPPPDSFGNSMYM